MESANLRLLSVCLCVCACSARLPLLIDAAFAPLGGESDRRVARVLSDANVASVAVRCALVERQTETDQNSRAANVGQVQSAGRE